MQRLPTAEEARLEEDFLERLPHAGFIIGHDEPWDERGKDAADLPEDLPIQWESAAGHDDGQDWDGSAEIIDDEIEDLKANYWNNLLK